MALLLLRKNMLIKATIGSLVMQKQDVQILEETWLHQSYLKLKRYQLRHKLFNGEWSGVVTRELITRPQVAAVLPYDPLLDKVVLIEQIRTGALSAADTPWLLEVVAGVAESGESLETLARRETLEEAGLEALELKLIYHYWVSPGMCDEKVALFYARVDASNAGGVYGLSEEHEDIKAHVMSSAEAFTLMDEGKVNNAMTLIALQWLRLHIGSRLSE
jgi:ADP-ribose pyrophosphatase